MPDNEYSPSTAVGAHVSTLEGQTKMQSLKPIFYFLLLIIAVIYFIRP